MVDRQAHCQTCTCGKVRLEWSDRDGWYYLENFYEAVIACALDHSYDRTSDGVPYGIPDAYRKAFAPVVEKHLSAVEPDWKNKTVHMWDKPEARAAFEAALKSAQQSVETQPCDESK